MHQDFIWSVASSAGTGSAVAARFFQTNAPFARISAEATALEFGLQFVTFSSCLRNFHSVTCAAFVSGVDTSTHYSPCFGLLLSGSCCPALTHIKHTHTDTHPSHTHSLETGCFQAYARIDGAFVCSVQSWRFEASLCFLFKAASQQQHTT